MRFFRPLSNVLALATLFIAFASVTAPITKVAAEPASLNGICNLQGVNTSQSAACNEQRKGGDPISGPTGILTRIIQILVYIVGIASVIMIIIGGFRYVLSHGDPGAVSTAKNSILYALVGLVVAILAQGIVAFVLKKL